MRKRQRYKQNIKKLKQSKRKRLDATLTWIIENEGIINLITERLRKHNKLERVILIISDDEELSYSYYYPERINTDNDIRLYRRDLHEVLDAMLREEIVGRLEGM